MSEVGNGIDGMIKMLRLRLATKEDCDLLFEWANDTECRRNSFSQEKIEYDIHVKWFHNRLQDTTSDLFIAIEDRKEVGMLRLDYNQNQAVISYSVATKERRKGYGKNILQLAEQYVREHRKDIQILVGEVKKENLVSMHRFEELGYEKKEYEECVEYTKELV